MSTVGLATDSFERTSYMGVIQLWMTGGFISGSLLQAGYSKFLNPLTSDMTKVTWLKLDQYSAGGWANVILLSCLLYLVRFRWKEPGDSSNSAATKSADASKNNASEEQSTKVSPHPTKPDSSYHVCFHIMCLPLMSGRILFGSYEAYLGIAAYSSYGWDGASSALCFMATSIASGIFLFGTKAIIPSRLNEVKGLLLIMVGITVGLVFCHGFLHVSPGNYYITPPVLFIIGGACWAAGVLASMPSIKGLLLKLCANMPDKVVKMGLASVYADIGRALGPVWVVLSCNDFDARALLEHTNGCHNPRFAIYGNLAANGIVLIIILLTRSKLEEVAFGKKNKRNDPNKTNKARRESTTELTAQLLQANDEQTPP
jgi:hypothetical protein